MTSGNGPMGQQPIRNFKEQSNIFRNMLSSCQSSSQMIRLNQFHFCEPTMERGLTCVCLKSHMDVGCPFQSLNTRLFILIHLDHALCKEGNIVKASASIILE